MNATVLEISSSDIDLAELDQATRILRDELLKADVCEVSQPTISTPPGAKSADTVLIGQLFLEAIGSGGLVVTLVSVLGDWLTRHKHLKLKLKTDETEIELSGANPEELKVLLLEVKELLSVTKQG